MMLGLLHLFHCVGCGRKRPEELLNRPVKALNWPVIALVGLRCGYGPSPINRLIELEIPSTLFY